MPVIRFNGDVRDASGAATILVVTGADLDFSDTFLGTFSMPLDLSQGDYLVSIECLTDGEMDFDIVGNLSNVNPDVPETFDSDQTSNTYNLTV